MSTKEELCIKAFPYLPGSDFDSVLGEAIAYHESHPPLEDGLVRNVAEPLPEDGREHQPLVDRVNRITLRNLLAEHREKLIVIFRRKEVPEDLACQIVDMLILAGTNPPRRHLRRWGFFMGNLQIKLSVL